MDKKMKNNSILFDVRGEVEFSHRVYNKMTAYKIFDRNIDAGFAFNGGFISDRYKVDTSSSIMYASVVSRVVIHIVLVMASPNDLEFELIRSSKHVPKCKSEGKGIVMIWKIFSC